nr:MAG TPA: hypothetical protein [Bacteriophage sp.]
MYFLPCYPPGTDGKLLQVVNACHVELSRCFLFLLIVQ